MRKIFICMLVVGMVLGAMVPKGIERVAEWQVPDGPRCSVVMG